MDADTEEKEQNVASNVDKAQHQESQFQGEIEAKVQSYKQKYGEKFDENAFGSYAKAYAMEHGSIDGIDAARFKQENAKETVEAGKDGYSITKERGGYVAHGPDGELFRAKKFAGLADDICAGIKQKQIAENRDTPVCFNTTEKFAEKKKKIFCRAALKNGLVIGEGYSNSPKFWKQMHEDYLKDPNHTEKGWDRLTSQIPDDVLGKKADDLTHKNSNAASLLGQLRKGKNPHLEAPVQTPKTSKMTPEQLQQYQAGTAQTK